MFKITFIIFYILFFILIPLNMTQAGLVPCGPGAGAACAWPDFYRLVKNIIDFMINLVFPISAVMIVVGGIMIMTAGDSSGRAATGKEIITAAVVGLLIALLSWLIIDTIMKILTNGRLGPWNQL
jgi:hypothetical protein